MSENLCYTDAYLRMVEATVTAVEPGPEDGSTGPLVGLDRTVFYPGGGGQPADAGVLSRTDGSRVTVTGARKSGDEARDLCLDALHLKARTFRDRSSGRSSAAGNDHSQPIKVRNDAPMPLQHRKPDQQDQRDGQAEHGRQHLEGGRRLRGRRPEARDPGTAPQAGRDAVWPRRLFVGHQ